MDGDQDDDATREVESVRGLAMMQPRAGFTPEEHMLAFMSIFHPEHPATPSSLADARKLVS